MTVKSMLSAIGANILGAVLAICLIAAGASAQFGPSIFTGKFTLPYEVHWGRTLLAPGTYFVSMESIHKAAIVRSTSEKTNQFVLVPSIGDAEKGTGTYLTIVYRGSERRVQALNLPELGKMLIYEPLTQAEREELANAGQVRTLFVATAKK